MFKKYNLKWVVCFICLVVFFGIAEDVVCQKIIKGDEIGHNLISTYLINDSLTPLVKAITWFGSATCLILLSLILIIMLKDKKQGSLIGVNLITITILNQLLKRVIQRPRPSNHMIIYEKGFSFPSGHSMVSMAFYGYLIYLAYKRIKNKHLKWLSISVLSILILLIGVSRIYLGVHYPSDVFGGFVISIAYLILFISLTNNCDLKKSNCISAR